MQYLFPPVAFLGGRVFERVNQRQRDLAFVQISSDRLAQRLSPAT